MRHMTVAHLMPLMLAVVPMTEPSAQAVRDSAGVSITSIDLEKPKGSVRLSARPVVDIGGSDVEREQLFRVASVARLGDDAIIVANNGTSSLKVFDRTGRYLRDLGRRGQGPAEFGNIERVWVLAGDTIVAADSRRRLVFFAASGQHLRTATLKPPPVGRAPRAIDLLPAGRLLVTATDVTTMPPSAAPYYFTQQLLVYGLDGEVTNSIGTFGAGEHFVQTVPPRMGGVAYWSRTFGRTTTIRGAGADVLVGDGSTFELRRFSQSGALTSILRASYVAPPVTAADKSAVRASDLERATPEDRPVDERRLAEMPYPDRFPAFQRFEVDPEGRIWVKRYPRPGEPRESWWVIAKDGTPLGELALPAGAALRAVGRDWVACVVKDADDVEHVQVYSVTITS